MIKYNYIFALLLAVSISHISNAQSRKKGNIKKSQNTLSEKDPAQRLFNEMLPFTEKILVADSVILDKRVMLDNIPMPKNLGVITTFGRFFNTKENPDGIVYRNEFADRCYVSMPDTAGYMHLYSIDKIGEKWDKPKLISDFNEDFTDISYPFMSDDGVTLIFAGKGKKSIGGYDLFRTIFDHEEGKFMEPENMGLPYNSTGNDYVFISDDIDSLCWLLSDRNMEEGKVCMYNIVKGNVRNTYKDSEVSKELLLRLAGISSIKDTWTLWDDKNAVNRALERKNKISSLSTEKVKNEIINFVILGIFSLNALLIVASVFVSTALVESSRIRIFGFLRSALAIQRRCFCPPDTLVPPCSIYVS